MHEKHLDRRKHRSNGSCTIPNEKLNQTKGDSKKGRKKLGFVYHSLSVKFLFISVNASVVGGKEVFQFGDLKEKRKFFHFQT
jgi:hypothetical protein